MPTTENSAGQQVEAVPVRAVGATTTTDETGKAVPVIPVRFVDAMKTTDEMGRAVDAMPVVTVGGATSTDSLGNAIASLPIREVAGLTTTNEAGQRVPVRPVFLVGGTPTPGPAYPAIVVARAKEDVWDLEAHTGHTEPLLYQARQAGPRDTLPAGLSYVNTGSQWYIRATGNGGSPIVLENWLSDIPLAVVNGAGEEVICNNCHFTGSGLVTAANKNIFVGYNQYSGAVADWSKLTLNDCTIDQDGALSFTNPISAALVGDPSQSAPNSQLVLNRTQIRRSQGSHIQVYGKLVADACFFGGHLVGFTDPDPLTLPHTESTWAALGQVVITNSLFDPLEGLPGRTDDTWTAHQYLVARFGSLAIDVHGNIFKSPALDAPYAIQIDIHEGNPGTFGSVKFYDNIIEKPVAGNVFNIPATPYTFVGRLEDNFELLTGDRITTPAEVHPDVTSPTITSSSSPSVAENVTLAHSLTATESVTWSIVGGADQADFEVSGATLRWVANGIKDYEIPDDANTNNSYVVTVRATDTAGNTADQTVTVTVTDVVETPSYVTSADSDGFLVWDTANHGTPSIPDPEGASKIVEIFERTGYDGSYTGDATTGYTATLKTDIVQPVVLTRRKRNLYPSQATDTADRVAPDILLYATDSKSGFTNNITEIAPKPICRVMMDGQQLIGDTLPWEIEAFHCGARQQMVGLAIARVSGTLAAGGTGTRYSVAVTPRISTDPGDKVPVEVYGGTLDTSAFAEGAILTWNCSVYPLTGGSGSVADTTDSAVAREFSPRYFIKNTAKFNSPPIARLSTSGNDATGVFSTNPVTAAASPFRTPQGAINAIASQSGVTGGIVDGCIIQVPASNSGDFVLANAASARAQTLGAVIFEPVPGTARGAAKLTLSSDWRARLGVGTLNAVTTEGAVAFRGGIQVVRTGSFAFLGESATKLRVYWQDALLNCGSVTASYLSNAHDYMRGLEISNASGNSILGQTAAEHRRMRGLQVDIANGAVEHWHITGSIITRHGAPGFADATKGEVIANSRFPNPSSTVAPFSIGSAGSAGQTITGIAHWQCEIEVRHTTTSTPAVYVSPDSAASFNVDHYVCGHLVVTGFNSIGRFNLMYDQTTGVHKTFKNWLVVGNIGPQLNSKGDVFMADASYVGNLGFAHGINCEGNFMMFRTNSAAASSEMQTYPGIGSRIGASNTIRLDPLFTDYKGTVDASTVGAGGGTYTLQAGSSARNLVRQARCRFDAAGNLRGTGSQNAGLYAN